MYHYKNIPCYFPSMETRLKLHYTPRPLQKTLVALRMDITLRILKSKTRNYLSFLLADILNNWGWGWGVVRLTTGNMWLDVWAGNIQHQLHLFLILHRKMVEYWKFNLFKNLRLIYKRRTNRFSKNGIPYDQRSRRP